MAETEEKKKKRRFNLKKLNKKYFFVMSHDETKEPIVNFRVNILNIIIIAVALAVILVIITTVLIAFTPLREYIPGYTEKASLEHDVYALYRRTDSIENELHRKDVYFKNLKLIIEGYDFENDSLGQKDIYAPFVGIDTDTIELKKSTIDSALRAEFEMENLYNLPRKSNLVKSNIYKGISNFFTPLTGTILQDFDLAKGHYGIDIAAKGDQVINAALDGTVVFASWTPDFGYTIGIQHDGEYFSTYKHNATLLKKEGDFVSAGEAIAILGESGDLPTEPHLHFELWHKGTPLDPQEYINFEKQ